MFGSWARFGLLLDHTARYLENQIVNAGEFTEGFYIYFRPVAQNDEGSYQMLTVLNTGASTFQISGLEKYTAYQIFLLPFYKNIDGRPSNYVNVTTAQDGKKEIYHLYLYSNM